MPSKTFAQHLDQLLKPLESGTQFNIYDVQTESSLSELFQDKKSTLQHHLILVTGIKTKNIISDNNEQNYQLICGIETDEYMTVHDNGELEKTLYIGKVDTTGTPEFKGVVNRVLQAYIKSVSPCTVHVFARSQPQYLFHLSARNKNKQVLSDRNLIRWWYKVLTACLEQNRQQKEEDKKEEILSEKPGLFGSLWKWMASSNDSTSREQTKSSNTIQKQATAWLSIPSIDDEQSTWYEIGEKPDLSVWRYGFPYDPNAIATNVLPRFEDDAKARLLKTFEGHGDDNTNMSVKDFWAMLGITEECGHHLTGIFVVKLDGSNSKNKKDVGNISKEIKREEYTIFWNYFMNLNFENEKNNKKSTKKFVTKWNSMKLGEPLIVNTSGSARSVKSANLTTINTSAAPSSSILTSDPKQVNILSTSEIKHRSSSNINEILTRSTSKSKQVNVLSTSSIKRRAITSTNNNKTSLSSTLTSEPQQVNVLPTSSIKRRPVANSKAHNNITNTTITISSSSTSSSEGTITDAFAASQLQSSKRRQKSNLDDIDEISTVQAKKARIL
ncbi:histone acetylation protein-domain-containing protein [Circinella umbellata]|nr:histone acetylation protein-domain-containing protein [Circinella umbellata]